MAYARGSFLACAAWVIPMALTTLSCRVLQPAVKAPEEPRAVPRDLPRIPSPDPKAVEVPEGYKVEVVIKDLTYPSSVEPDDKGNLYVAEAGMVYGDHSAPARVLKVSSAGAMEVVADQLGGPITDLLWHKGNLYISHRGKISMLTPAGEIHDLVTDLPSLGDHHNNQLSVGPDGNLYFGQGTATNSGVVGIDNFLYQWLPQHPGFHDRPGKPIILAGREFTTANPFVLSDPERPKLMTTAPFQAFGRGTPEDGKVPGTTKASGTILRMHPDGSGLSVYAWGLRNPFGVCWGPDGKLYVADNGYDERGTRPVANSPDFVWQVKESAWYGWPDYVGGAPITDPQFKPKGGPQPEFLMAEHPPVERPFLERPMHSAVAKIDFCRSANFGFEGHLFLAEAGDMNPITGHHGKHVGFQVIRIDPKTGEAASFFRARKDALGPKDFEYAATAGPKRPVDVRFSPDGEALYVVDIGALVALPTIVPMVKPFPGTGAVWRITRQGREAKAAPPPDLSAKPGEPAVR